MPIEILMPALSPTMTEGTLAKWLKTEGDAINAGDTIAEIETDKATMEVEAVDEGRLGKILVAAGTQNVAVNAPIALLLLDGEDATALSGAATAGSASSSPPASAAPAASQASAPPTTATPAVAVSASGTDRRVFASPLARRMAHQAGLPLSTIAGSGPNGRIVKTDVERAIAADATAAVVPGPQPAAAASASASAPAVAPAAAVKPPVVASGPDAKTLSDVFGLRYEAKPNSSMRKTIARRLTEAKQTIPHFYLTVDCELDTLLAMRKQLNDRSDEYKLSVNDFVIRACALALKAVPQANAAWTEDATLFYEHADVSVAVATPDGLITPIIKQAETKGLATLSNEMKGLARKARDGKLKPEDYQGGSFTISNLGMFGVREFAAIINPPQGCLLAVGAGEQRAVVKEGALTIATLMSCTLSTDHRVVDGAIGAQFLAAFKRLIEDPLTMLL